MNGILSLLFYINNGSISNKIFDIEVIDRREAYENVRPRHVHLAFGGNVEITTASSKTELKFYHSF